MAHAKSVAVDNTSLSIEVVAGHTFATLKAGGATIHFGPYMQVGKTYKRLMKYAAEHDLALIGHSIEHFIDDPTKVEKDSVRTDVMIPLRD